jgi:hypothetical protein
MHVVVAAASAAVDLEDLLNPSHSCCWMKKRHRCFCCYCCCEVQCCRYFACHHPNAKTRGEEATTMTIEATRMGRSFDTYLIYPLSFFPLFDQERNIVRPTCFCESTSYCAPSCSAFRRSSRTVHVSFCFLCMACMFQCVPYRRVRNVQGYHPSFSLIEKTITNSFSCCDVPVHFDELRGWDSIVSATWCVSKCDRIVVVKSRLLTFNTSFEQSNLNLTYFWKVTCVMDLFVWSSANSKQ